MKINYNLEMNVLFLEESSYQSFEKNPLVIGGLIVTQNKIKEVNNQIKEIKAKHGIKALTEVKWTKTGKSKILAYKELIDFALENDQIKIRVLVAKNKKNIDLSYKDWYSRLHYTLLNKSPFNINGIISDNKGFGLHETLNKTINISLSKIPIKEYVNSKDSQIIQLSDIFLGAISSKNGYAKNNFSIWKKQIIEHISKKMNITSTTSLFSNQQKYSIFFWEGY